MKLLAAVFAASVLSITAALLAVYRAIDRGIDRAFRP